VTDVIPQAARNALRARLAATLPSTWRTRFAPAPTGPLHLGHAVNAVYVWSIARAFGGSVLLRIEDHDGRRARSEFDTGILNDLEWLGLTADNVALGVVSPLTQRADAAPYETALRQLADRGLVYACRCSRREIAAAAGDGVFSELRYPGICRRSEVPSAETPARRVQLEGDTVAFDDLRHGLQLQIPSQQCGDVLVRDRHAQWTYQFAVTVDDLRQGIDVIIRGDDLLESTGRQIILSSMLGRATPPQFLHHPLVIHPDGTKLSKSQGDTGLAELRRGGWTPDRVLGHAAWLGGLQAAAKPLRADELVRLWVA
jgi:glutamyl-Q tRNA(Asp) synthetase